MLPRGTNGFKGAAEWCQRRRSFPGQTFRRFLVKVDRRRDMLGALKPNLEAISLSNRDEYLREVIQDAERQLMRLPKGRVSYQRGDTWVYKGPEKIRRITGPNDPLLRDLILRSYLEKLCRAANQELYARGKFEQHIPQVKMEEVYDRLSDHRKQIIQPFIPTPQQYIDDWLHRPYPSHNPVPLNRDFPTGVPSCPYVRSKSEVLEVQGLTAEDMAFLYEFPLMLATPSGGRKTIYPDFTILNKTTHKVLYWEHFGQMDSPSYLSQFKFKQELYAYNGIYGSQLYQTFEYSSKPLTKFEIDAVIADLKTIAG